MNVMTRCEHGNFFNERRKWNDSPNNKLLNYFIRGIVIKSVLLVHKSKMDGYINNPHATPQHTFYFFYGPLFLSFSLEIVDGIISNFIHG
jgi:hypothetical protein